MTIILDNTGFSVDHWTRFTEMDLIKEGFRQRSFARKPDSERIELLKLLYKLLHNDAP